MVEAIRGPKPGMKPETHAARQLFLYGGGDGKRVINVKQLVEATGVHEATIRRNMPEWEREFESMLAGTTETGLQLALSAETLRLHRSNISFLKAQLEDCRAELERLPALHELLEKLLLAFTDAPEKDYSAALAIFKAFHQTTACKKAAQSHFLALQKAWNANSGVEGLQDVAVTREKTLATGRAKLRLAEESKEQGTGDPATAATPAAGRIFRRGSAPPATVDSVPDDWDGLGE